MTKMSLSCKGTHSFSELFFFEAYFFSFLQVSSSIFDKKWVFLSNILDEMRKTLVN